MDQDESPVDAVTDELGQLAERLVLRAFDNLGTQGPLRLTKLGDIAGRSFPELWQTDRVVALEATLKHAASYLDGRLGKRTKRYATLLLFNLDGSPEFPEVKKLSLDYIEGDRRTGESYWTYLLRRLLEQIGRDGKRPSTRRRELRNVRVELATVLSHSQFPDIPAHSEVSPVSDAGVETGASLSSIVIKPLAVDTFIARPEYETAIRQLRDSGESVVWLHGDAGTGKTRLAGAANRDMINEKDVPVLPAGDRNVLDQYLSNLLVRHGVKAETINPANVWPLFFEGLRTGTMPPVVVFDDARGDVLDLLPSDSQSFIVFTSIDRPPPRYQGATIEVGDLANNETHEMIASRLRDATNVEREALAGVLGGRPLAIEHSCAYIRETGISIRSFCLAVSQQPDVTLDVAGSRHGTTLTRVYELILERIQEQPDTIRALDCITYCEPHTLSVEMLLHLWADESAPMPGDPRELFRQFQETPAFLSYAELFAKPGVVHVDSFSLRPENPLQTVSMHAALRKLQDFGLIRSENDAINMHSLTRKLLRALRRDHEQATRERILTAVRDAAKSENWVAGSVLSWQLVRWALNVSVTLQAMYPSTKNTFATATDRLLDDAGLAAMVLRCERQLATGEGFSIENTAQLIHITLYARLCLKQLGSSLEDFFGKYRELYVELLEQNILDVGFNYSKDTILPYNKIAHPYTSEKLAEIVRQPPTPQQVFLARNIRATYDTEWQPASHAITDVDAIRTQSAADMGSPALLVRGGRDKYLESARISTRLSTVFTARALWSDAIAALENAYSCYLKLSGRAEYTRRAMDSARRLSQVHLRMGQFDRATEWLMRAQWLRQERIDNYINGERTRYAFVDIPFEMSFIRAADELELTRQLIVWDEAEESDPETLIRFATEPHRRVGSLHNGLSRVEACAQMANSFRRAGLFRFLPDTLMLLYRLRCLAQDYSDRDGTFVFLSNWFRDTGLTYQSDLLVAQTSFIQAPVLAAMLGADFDLNASGEVTDEVRDMIVTLRSARGQLANNLYQTARAMLDRYENRYWYARGLCASYIVGLVTDIDGAWLRGLHTELEEAVGQVGRADWIERVDQYGHSNAGLWLFGY